jgi:hypothetical protein
MSCQDYSNEVGLRFLCLWKWELEQFNHSDYSNVVSEIQQNDEESEYKQFQYLVCTSSSLT